jgi:phosphoglycerate dehydrogenase-like enzyme
MKNILIDMPVEAAALQHLRSIPGLNVRLIEPKEESRPLSADIISDVHILFCTFPPENISDMKCLELIQISTAGYSQLYNVGLVENGVRACNALGIYDVPIAEWNLAMMVNLARDLRGMIRNQEAQIWDRPAVFQREIRGLTVGIWGYGGIGRETARLAKALGMSVHVRSRHGIGRRTNAYHVSGVGDPEGVLPDRVFLAGQELEFLANLDFLILAAPLTKTTEGIVGERELRALPRTAFVLNPARGPLIAERALLQALREGWIAGAALDTHYYYPMPPDHPLWRLPNVIMTPHISGSSLSPHTLDRSWDIFMQNVERYTSGKTLLNELTTTQLSGE